MGISKMVSPSVEKWQIIFYIVRVHTKTSIDVANLATIAARSMDYAFLAFDTFRVAR